MATPTSVYGTAGNDTLMGGAGNDLLQGGAGDDTYLFGSNGGHDLISDGYGNDDLDNDTLFFKAGVLPGDVDILRTGDSGKDLLLALRGTSTQITIQGWLGDGPHGIKQIVFADGTVWEGAEILSRLSVVATDGGDLIWGGADNDAIAGLEGDDQLNGQGGNDSLDGGEGQMN